MTDKSKNTIKHFLELTPIVLFAFNIVLYVCYCASEFYDITFIMKEFYLLIQQFIESSFISLLTMHLLCYLFKWGHIPKICLYGLTALWFNNLPYIIFGWHTGIYFGIFSTIIYCIVIIFAVIILTNR